MKEKLDAEDIVGWRDVLLSDYKDIENQEQINALCGMALSSLTARDEGIEAAAKVCDERADFFDGEETTLHVLHQREKETAEDLAKEIRALIGASHD